MEPSLAPPFGAHLVERLGRRARRVHTLRVHQEAPGGMPREADVLRQVPAPVPQAVQGVWERWCLERCEKYSGRSREFGGVYRTS